MKKVAHLAFLCLFLILIACKKSSKPQGVQIQVSGLPAGTTLSLRATDQIGVIYNQTVSSDGTYTTGNVTPGDNLAFYYTLSKSLSTDVLLKFYYNNEQMGGTGFFESGSINESVPQP